MFGAPPVAVAVAIVAGSEAGETERRMRDAVTAAAAAGADLVELPGHTAPAATESVVAAVRRDHPELAAVVRIARRDAAKAMIAAGAHALAAGHGTEPDWLAGLAGAARCGVLARSAAGAERAVAAGVPREAILLDADEALGRLEPARLAAGLRDVVGSGWPVIVSADAASPTASAGASVGELLDTALATAAVCVWLGAQAVRVPVTGAPAPHPARGLRDVVDMVASIRGVRPPAVARRGLA